MFERLQVPFKQACQRFGFFLCDDSHRTTIFEHAQMPMEVVSKQGRAWSRIEGDRDPTGQKYSKKTEKIIGIGLQHQHNRIARLKVEPLQSKGNSL